MESVEERVGSGGLWVPLGATGEGHVARVRESISVGDRGLRLQGLDLAQSVGITGSLALSIQEAFKLTSEGQLTVTARYEAASQPSS
jgi:hypothetical protein